MASDRPSRKRKATGISADFYNDDQIRQLAEEEELEFSACCDPGTSSVRKLCRVCPRKLKRQTRFASCFCAKRIYLQCAAQAWQHWCLRPIRRKATLRIFFLCTCLNQEKTKFYLFCIFFCHLIFKDGSAKSYFVNINQYLIFSYRWLLFDNFLQ